MRSFQRGQAFHRLVDDGFKLPQCHLDLQLGFNGLGFVQVQAGLGFVNVGANA